MELQKINLSDILLAYVEFLAEPENSEHMTKIDNILSSIVIRQYVPLEDKVKIMLKVIGCAQVVDDMDGVQLSMNIEIGKMVTGLIEGYCINVTNDLDLSALQLAVFDLIYDTGFVDYILDKGARRDFERLDKMIDNALNMNNLIALLNGFTNFNPENMNQMFAAIDGLKNELTPEKIEFLKNVMKTGTPEFDKLSSVLNEKILRDTLGSDVLDKFNTTSFGLATDIEKNIVPATDTKEEEIKEEK